MSASNSRISLALLLFLGYFPGFMLCAVVSLSSIEIFNKHEWLKTTSTVYFLCEGENKSLFEDVKRTHFVYAFNGQQSWQVLSNFSSKKCKPCGLYEENSITPSDDAFDEWELCPSDFTSPHGEYIKFKEKQFNATFLCPDCLSLVSSTSGKRGKRIAILVFLGALAPIVLILGVFGAYKYWLKKKKEEDQAQLWKLFEDSDEIEDELGLGGSII
ncbi:unnamed protein product [Trifolium pratense]|uniref:Uncharacterized protein n=1 Tax=Trifolium pratense TaxID=57577 RepID=A0ACB0K697_TRIPR|nr:unnamed protein product [Trifolium pratense]